MVNTTKHISRENLENFYILLQALLIQAWNPLINIQWFIVKKGFQEKK